MKLRVFLKKGGGAGVSSKYTQILLGQVNSHGRVQLRTHLCQDARSRVAVHVTHTVECHFFYSPALFLLTLSPLLPLCPFWGEGRWVRAWPPPGKWFSRINSFYGNHDDSWGFTASLCNYLTHTTHINHGDASLLKKKTLSSKSCVRTPILTQFTSITSWSRAVVPCFTSLLLMFTI